MEVAKDWEQIYMYVLPILVQKKSHTMDLPIEIENEQAIQDSAGSEREIE